MILSFYFFYFPFIFFCEYFGIEALHVRNQMGFLPLLFYSSVLDLLIYVNVTCMLIYSTFWYFSFVLCTLLWLHFIEFGVTLSCINFEKTSSLDSELILKLTWFSLELNMPEKWQQGSALSQTRTSVELMLAKNLIWTLSLTVALRNRRSKYSLIKITRMKKKMENKTSLVCLIKMLLVIGWWYCLIFYHSDVFFTFNQFHSNWHRYFCIIH